jgi:hypothetical protein
VLHAPAAHAVGALVSSEVSLSAVFSEPFLPGCLSAGSGAIQTRAKAVAFAQTGIDDEALTTMGASAGTSSVTVSFHHHNPK